MTMLAGVDIGGTKIAVCLGETKENSVEVISKKSFPTPERPETAIPEILNTLEELLMAKTGTEAKTSTLLQAIGVSCGSPLDSKNGLILSPPNLPGWDRVDILGPLREKFGVPASLQNDANACALAEWQWGAGKGCRNMVFLTFGTGMGAGLILDGRLYTGTNDMAGEVGHVRIENDGPVGYGKAGSFEGFCSGGGIARLAKTMAEELLKSGNVSLSGTSLLDLPHITTEKVGEAAQQGDPLALEIFGIVGRKLGRGLAMIVDILNPERIVIGSIYGRQQSILQPIVLAELQKEALPQTLSVCEIKPAGLKENVGDLASLSVAFHLLQEK